MPQELVLQSPVPELVLYIPRGMTYAFWGWGGVDALGAVVDYTGYTPRGQILDIDPVPPATATNLLATFNVTENAPTQSDAISQAYGYTAQWLFVMTVPASATDYSVTAIDTALNQGVFDIELVNGSTIVKLCRGTVIFLDDRTHL